MKTNPKAVFFHAYLMTFALIIGFVWSWPIAMIIMFFGVLMLLI